MATLRDVALLRLAAQRLVGPGLPGGADVVAWMTAMQAQDLASALAAVRLRTSRAAAPGAEVPAADARGTDTPGTDAPAAAVLSVQTAGTDAPGRDIAAALDDGRVVRSWPMRGTLHLVPAVDLGWMLDLTGDRLLASTVRRRAQLGIDEAMIARARDETEALLGGGRSATRAELLATWERAGLLGVPGRGYHLLFHLSVLGLTCYGPTADGDQRVVLLAEWVPAPRRPDREAALAEWVLRYARSHGPVSRADAMRWTGLTAADVRRGLAAVAGELDTLEVDGVVHHLDPATPALLDAARSRARSVLLVPAFDELVLGYGDRSALVDAAFADRIVPGGNGMFRPVVVAGGRAVGTWRRVGSGARRRVEAEPFTTFGATVERGIARAAARLP